MKKREVIAAFIARIEEDLMMIKNAAMATHDAATNEESKPENQYDTRALEAAYLAGAQAKRAAEIDEVLSLFRTLSFKDLTAADPVQATALVEIDLDGKRSKVLMMPKGGGVSLKHGNDTVQIVTPASVLGESILGLNVGQTTSFEVGQKVRECEIVAIS